EVWRGWNRFALCLKSLKQFRGDYQISPACSELKTVISSVKIGATGRSKSQGVCQTPQGSFIPLNPHRVVGFNSFKSLTCHIRNYAPQFLSVAAEALWVRQHRYSSDAFYLLHGFSKWKILLGDIARL